MERLIKGDIIVVQFPFTDFTATKKRPALVFADFGNEIVLCQITTQIIKDRYAVELSNSDFRTGNIDSISNIRPNRIFTVNKKLVSRKIGSVKAHIVESVINCVIEYLKD